MADHGVRLPPYLSGNLAQGIMGEAPFGWTGTPTYRAELLPANQYFPAEQFAYERLDWDKFAEQGKALFGGGTPMPGHYSNPNFVGASQMLGGHIPDWMKIDGGNKVARILRGFMRRQEVDPADGSTFVRLNFMWNPDELTRQYVTVTDTLDPTGALQIEQEGNVLPPTLVDVTFTLYFDRQAEVATVKDHPGVLVDLQAFDVLAGNAGKAGTMAYKGEEETVDPLNDPNRPIAGPVGDLPPNVTMGDQNEATNPMLAPIPIAAVFSPTFAFYGKLTGATATFTKFSSRMTPTAMTLTINMTLYSVGRLTNQYKDASGVLQAGASGAQPSNPELYNPSLGFNPAAATPAQLKKANEAGAANALNWGLQYIGTPYERDASHRMDGPPNNDLPFRSDCSSFVFRCLQSVGWDKLLHLGYGANSDHFVERIRAHPEVWEFHEIRSANQQKRQQILNWAMPGDVLVKGEGNKVGHVAMFAGWSARGANNTPPPYGDKVWMRVESTPEEVKHRAYTGPDMFKSGPTEWELWARPTPFKVPAGTSVRGPQ